MEAAVAENIMAGNVMSRRASYMYGNLLKPEATGQVGAGLGTTTSAGTVTLIAPTNIIEKDGQKEVIDGLTYDFMLAPGSEAPSEMLWYIEEKNSSKPQRMLLTLCTIPTRCAVQKFVNRYHGRNTSTKPSCVGVTKLKLLWLSTTGRPGVTKTLLAC